MPLQGNSLAVLRLSSLAIISQAIALGLTPTSVSLTASPSPSNYGQAVTLTTTVTSGATGKVTFYEGTTIFGRRHGLRQPGHAGHRDASVGQEIVTGVLQR
jgi:hypothetical protein